MWIFQSLLNWSAFFNNTSFLLLYHRRTRKTSNSSVKSWRSSTILPLICHTNSREPLGPSRTFPIATMRVVLRCWGWFTEQRFTSTINVVNHRMSAIFFLYFNYSKFSLFLSARKQSYDILYEINWMSNWKSWGGKQIFSDFIHSLCILICFCLSLAFICFLLSTLYC